MPKTTRPRPPLKPGDAFKYEWHKFMTHSGAKAFFRAAADLQGLTVDVWMREALHSAALSVHRAHGIEPKEVPPVHPIPPPPLQSRT